MLWALSRRDEAGIVEVLLDWVRDGEVDEARLAAEVSDMIFDYGKLALKDLRVSAVLQDTAGMMRRHSIVLPADLALLFKALITVEGLGRQLDPDFQLVDHLTPFLQRLMQERYQPAVLLQRGRRRLVELATLVGRVPEDLRQLLREARRGRLKIELDLKRLDRSANRLTVGIVTAALIVGSSIVMTVEGGPTLLGLPLFGFLGFLLAFVAGAWLLVSMGISIDFLRHWSAAGAQYRSRLASRASAGRTGSSA